MNLQDLNFADTHALKGKTAGHYFPKLARFLRKSGEYETESGGREIRVKSQRLGMYAHLNNVNVITKDVA